MLKCTHPRGCGYSSVIQCLPNSVIYPWILPLALEEQKQTRRTHGYLISMLWCSLVGVGDVESGKTLIITDAGNGYMIISPLGELFQRSARVYVHMHV